jgi:cytochrome bd ubiquinol oxidase subunit II
MAVLESIWFLLWGILWAVYFSLGGFDLGVGILSPFLGKSEGEKNALLGSIGPFWDGNEVWLITAGGVTFAAFPAAYATLFSAFYTPLMLVLFGLIIRAVSIEFRNRPETSSWRGLADAGVLVGSFLPALLFGVAFANIFKGIPIDGDGVFQGNLLTLLNPYGLAGGLFFLALFLVHGALWINHRSTGAVRERSRDLARLLWLPLVVLAVIFLVLTALYTRLWANYLAAPVLLIIPLVAVAALLSMRYFMAKAAWGRALLASFGVILFAVLFGVTGLYPYLLPSTIDGAYSLSIRNAASSPSSLAIMLVVALIFVPIVIIYQAWVYRLFLKKESSASSG